MLRTAQECTIVIPGREGPEAASAEDGPVEAGAAGKFVSQEVCIKNCRHLEKKHILVNPKSG